MRLACNGLFSRSEEGATIVTPSRLVAAVVNQQLAKAQLDRGLQSWRRAPVHSVNSWLSASWNETRYALADVPTLLSSSQEHVLWQQIIEQQHGHLFDVASTARLAARAAKLLAEWHIPVDGDLWNDHEDGQQFLEWHKLFRRRCRDERWMTKSDVWRLLPNWIAARGPTPEFTVFAGFHTFTPALERVKHLLGERFIRDDARLDLPSGGTPAKLCEDLAQEVEQAARWSRALFERQPSRSIAILVPDLSSHRSLVERTFQQVFYPAAVLRLLRTPTQEEPDSVFRINDAPSLRTHPLIASALLLVELTRPRIDIGVAGAILRSPFLAGAAEERSERALADLDLRKKRELDVSLRDVEYASRNCPLLLPVLASVHRIIPAAAHKLELPKWSEFFAAILRAVDWPGRAEVTEQEGKVIEAWSRAVSELGALGLVSSEVSYDIALAHLRGLLSSPGIERGDWSSPIQILDASEAAGLEFDSVFVTGLSDETWPPRLATYPLVPLKLQRAYDVPASSPEGAQQERQRMTASLFAAAPNTIATYSGRLSPLAQPFVRRDRIPSVEWPGKLPRQSFMPVALDEIEDTSAPPYEQNEGTRGGASLIKAQSLCPFRAFAEFRLAANAPEDGCLGFDSRERGGFVHTALQNVWARLKTHQQLLATARDELCVLVRDAVEQAVRNREAGPFHELMSRTECERLERVIHEWLDLERQRKQPFRVETLEQKRLYDFPGLRLHLRADRLDRLRNGKLVLIDYKSGAQTRGKLKCPRPAEPQLLLYATAVGGEVDGLFFGELKPREPRAVGFSRERQFPGSAAEVKKDWSLFIAQSEAEVQRLAAEFVHGYAAVDPIKGACEYCRIKPFCRVHEAVVQECDPE